MTDLSEIAVGLRRLADLLDTFTPAPGHGVICGNVTVSTHTAEEWWAWRDLLGPDAEVEIGGALTWVRLRVTPDVRLCVYAPSSMLCTTPTEPVLAPRPEATS